jgi:hypothetical protein
MFSFWWVEEQPSRKAARMLKVGIILFIIILFLGFQFNSCKTGDQV